MPWGKIQKIGWTRNDATGCLEYNGHRNWCGYGQFRPGRGKLLRVHRLAYENWVGPLEAHEKVLHLCDNPACSEPSHLRKGSQSDNLKDMWSKGRGYKQDWTHCPNGHPYPEKRPPKATKNRCRECAKERNRRYYAKKR